MDDLPMRFTRVMPGEYFSKTEFGRYEIDVFREGCSYADCAHSHEGWHLQLSTGYNRIETLGDFRTYCQARAAAEKHYYARKDQ